LIGAAIWIENVSTVEGWKSARPGAIEGLQGHRNYPSWRSAWVTSLTGFLAKTNTAAVD
jgi:hypothetical protein